MSNVMPSTPDVARLEARAKSGANWFFWIAGLSLVNTASAFSGSDWRFIIGTGITQVADVLILRIEGDAAGMAKALALVFDLFVAGVLVGLGVLARKRHHWAFVVGMVAYALDGLIFLFVKDWFSVAFHAFAVYSIFTGLRASRQLSQLPPTPVVLAPVPP